MFTRTRHSLKSNSTIKSTLAFTLGLSTLLGGCSQGMLASPMWGGSGGGPTGTGVFINGVEATGLEVAVLSARVGHVPPGRWWLDAAGNYGPEGGGMMGNLNGGNYASGNDSSGGDHSSSVFSTYDRTGVAVNEGGVLMQNGNSWYPGK